MGVREIQPRAVRAEEFYGDFWFNGEPVTLGALRGRVVLVAFWDYVDAGSIRALPYLSEWTKKYAQEGLVTVAVHTPRFPFGRDPESVARAIHRLGIAFPVVMDNDALIASRYGNRSWPTIFLIDHEGFVRCENTGDANYAMTEHMIQTLLYGAGVGEMLPDLMEPLRDADRVGAVCYRATPDLYTGYLRGSIGNVEGYNPESTVLYSDPGIYLGARFYAHGPWMNGKDSIRFAGSGDREGELILEYSASEVHSVIGGEENLDVTVRQDGRYLDAANKGDDVRLGADGRSYLVTSEPRSCCLVRNPEFGEHTLRLATRGNGFAVYAFTFVSAVIPELISNN